jgi:hypothetical protein
MTTEAALVKKIVRRHGTVIDLEKQPEVIIEIIRRFGPELDDDGGLPGGVPPSPPPGPTSFQAGDPTIREVMKEVLKISRQVTKITKQLGV